MGRLLDAGDITRLNAIFVSDILRRQPFMHGFSRTHPPYRSPMVQLVGRQSNVDRDGRGPVTMSSTPYGSNIGYCSGGFMYCLDGSPVRLGIEEIDGMVSPADIRGIEIYRRPHEVPGEFGGGLYGCGVIVIWTR